MSFSFPASDVCLCAAQAGTVALPGSVRLIAPNVRWGPWGLVPLASIIGSVIVLRHAAGAASVVTYLSLCAVPALAALALACGIRGASARLAPLVVPLFLLAWLGRHTSAGQLAAVGLSMLACVALAVLLTQVAPHRWLKAGILLASLADVAMIAAHYLQPAQQLLDLTTPSFDLPAFQRVMFSSVAMGFGDFFLAALLGAVLAAEGARQDRAAVLTFAFALVFDLLFIAIPMLPATVPVAAALVVTELRRRRARVPGASLAPPLGPAP